MSSATKTNYCVDICASLWLSILPSAGAAPLPISGACTTTCQVCQPIACGPCAPPQSIKPQGESYEWDGTVWEVNRCGPQNYSCVNQLCLPPGHYVARMCASKATSDAGSYCMGASTPTCVEVPFDFPTSQVIEGVLP
jgi:hypothetical protein